jgi:hypothetical protein
MQHKDLTKENKQQALTEIRGQRGLTPPAAPMPAPAASLTVPAEKPPTAAEIEEVDRQLKYAGLQGTPAQKAFVLKKLRARK